MAYTKSNEIMTRISLKYDSYENWTSKNPVLLKGEVAIATIAKPQNGEHATGFQNLPNVVMKVGDDFSHYNDLKFVSGLAADVYDWAKQANKPSYALSEIANAVEYQLVAIDATAYKYQLQSRKAGSSEAWAKVSDLDLSGINSRLGALEADLNTEKTGLKARMGAAEERLDAIDGENGRLAKLETAVGADGAVADMITDAIVALDTTMTQAAGDDGLALKIVQKDGVITEFSGSIAAGTYDAYGAAKAVRGGDDNYKETVKSAYDRADAAYELADNAQTADEVAAAITEQVKTLKFTGVEGAQSGATIKFVDKISQANGIVSAELGELKLQSAYVPEAGEAQNLIATMKDVTAAVAELNGAMHFEGVSTTDPAPAEGSGKVTITGKPDYTPSAGDVVIYDISEYVYDGSKWVKLGDEGVAAKLIQNLDVTDINVGADSTLTVIGQTDGSIHATVTKIEIAQDQVTGLSTALTNKLEASVYNTFKKDEFTPVKEDVDTLTGDANTAGSVAHSINTAVANLKNTDAAVDGQYVKAVTQSNGIVTVERANLPTLAITHDSNTEEPAATEVTVVKDIGHNGFTITDTHIKVATKAGVNAAIAALSVDKDVSSPKHVMTGITQENGVIKTIDEVELADIAFSGNVADLKQTANTYVVFNCGSAEINI